MNDELAFFPLVHQARVDQLADEVGGHGAFLILLLKLLNLLSELHDLERLNGGIGFLLSGCFLIGLDLGLGSSPFA